LRDKEENENILNELEFAPHTPHIKSLRTKKLLKNPLCAGHINPVKFAKSRT
jgi:hypothetical protein